MTQQAISLTEGQEIERIEGPAALDRILVALDASEYADRALAEAVSLANTADGVITGIHAYAAQLHDRRFRQMEGGLPEKYLEEKEMEHQRDVHDDLITRGLNIISDSYHDVAQTVCDAAERPFRRLSPEGKNYSCVVEAAGSGDFGVLALGALGLGAVQGSTIGTVCERVVRRSAIDVLVVKDPNLAIGDGPIVVGLDGSSRSFGAFKTAMDIGKRLSVPVHAVAAYDPYYHYVAFNKISGVLSEEAGKVFRFKEQERLHEELIDEGIAKIYQSHLDVAEQIAGDGGVDLVCKLLEGKPFIAIRDYLKEVGASLLVVGKTGVHADTELDIGGNTENLLRLAPCHVWIGQVQYDPPLDVVAEETTAWSEEAEAVLARAPSFVQGMARTAILRSAHEKGHTFITANFVEEVASQLMPGGMSGSAEAKEVVWSTKAQALLDKIQDQSLTENIRLRAEKRTIQAGSGTVEVSHVQHFLRPNEAATDELTWTAAALARLSRVPEPMRDGTRGRIEGVARQRRVSEISMEIVEAGLNDARREMQKAMGSNTQTPNPTAKKSPEKEPRVSKCPFAKLQPAQTETLANDLPMEVPLSWDLEADKRMERIPEGFMREMTRQRIETFARHHGVSTITSDLVREKYAEWAEGSAKQDINLEWQETAQARIDRIPGFVRGMVILEVERRAREMGLDSVTDEVIDQTTSSWQDTGSFHSEVSPDGDE